MRFLLDTNVFIWAEAHPRKLSSRARRAITDGSNDLVVSCVSIWEIITKVARGSLEMAVSPADFDRYFEKLGIAQVLAIQPNHVFQLRALPRVHDDPFDRMLVAQAQVEGLRMVTADALISEYYLSDVIW